MWILRIAKWVMRLLLGPLGGLGGKALSSVATRVLGEGGANVPALLEKFSSSGLANLAQSWVGKGTNKSLSAEQVQSVLSDEAISGIADDLGTSPEAAAKKVAGVLPQLIDKLTPDGLVPDPEALAQKLETLLKKK